MKRLARLRYRILVAGILLSAVAISAPLYMRSKLNEISELHQYSIERWKRLTELNVQAKSIISNRNHADADVLQTAMVAVQDEQDELLSSIHINNRAYEASKKAFQTTTYVGIFFFIVLAVLMLSLWQTLIPGISRLLLAISEFRKGNFSYRTPDDGYDETAELARALNEMAVYLSAHTEKLRELNQLKSDFVSTVSHELRTPLTAIKGSIGLILGNMTGEISEETREMLNIAHRNADRLIRLINDVLDIAKIEAGAIRMHFKKHGVLETIEHAVIGLRPYAESHGIRIESSPSSTLLEKSPLVVMDRDKIEQVVTNLVSNAIKFSDAGATVRVKCEWNDEAVFVFVEDSGPGVSEEFQNRIFEKFQQEEGSANKAKEGTGLGLAIAKAIVNEHRGEIWVKSHPGSGSIFAFSIPWNGKDFIENIPAAISVNS
ncbi:MAG: sensor histidine kinase [Bacteriovoracia bacterium]